MNARASTSNPPPKSFITPSDSSRSQSFASSPIRTFRDGVPPTKRRRLASTPTSSSLSLSTPRSSSSRPEPPPVVDLHDARKASSMRVLNIWSALAERYNRRIDEDDIVDIRTGQVIKDRGVLSELPKRYNFGDLADKEEDLAVNTDPGSEVADNLAEDEEDDDQDEPDAFSSSVSSQIARLAPLRPATSSSDADDLREFLKAEEIRRELDGGDESSEDEFNILPPRSTPVKRTMTPARKTPFTARAKSRPTKTPIPDTESEDEFAVSDRDQNDIYCGYRARRTPSPEVPASIPSPPPPSSSPRPSSSFSYPSSPLLSRTPLNSSGCPPIRERAGSPTPKRQPLASTSRRTLEDSLNEIDLEFPPPQPRAPSIFGRRPNSPFIIDLSLSDDEGEQPHPTVNATPNLKPLASEPRAAKKNGSALISKRPIPFVLIETKRPTPVIPTKRAVLPKSTQKSDPKPRSTRKSTTKPRSTRSARSTESGTSMTTARPKSRASRKLPEVCEDRSSPPLPPSPSPAPPTRPRIRGRLKRKRIVSSGSSSGEQQGSPKDDTRQQTSRPDGDGILVRTARTPEITDVDGDDHASDPDAGEPKPQTPSQSSPNTLTEVASTPAFANTISVAASSSNEQREDDIQNRFNGSYTYLPAPPPLPLGFPSQTHQPFAPYPGHPPPFQSHAASFPYMNRDHNQYVHEPYPLFQDPNTQALLARTVTQLAILMNGGRLPPQLGHMGGMTGSMPTIDRFPGSPGWGTLPAWPPSTPTTSRYPHGYDHQQQSFQSPHVSLNQTGGGVGPPMPPSTQFPQSGTSPPLLSRPESIPAVRESGAVQERTTSRARSRSKSKRRVTFVLDTPSRSGSADRADDPAETLTRGGDGSTPMTRGRSRIKGCGEGGA